jgi:1,2-diacylglycerol 3-beta-glucosyltransferase
MPENSWPENDSYNELEPLDSLLSECRDAIQGVSTEEFESEFFQGLAGRRRKAAFALTVIWGSTVALHFIVWGSWLVVGLTALLFIQALRVVFARPLKLPEPLSEETKDQWPYVSLLVAAKNEEAVIGRLVRTLCNQDYPVDRYEVWVIDDHSTDRTPLLLEQLAKEYRQMKVLRRPANASGGKSGALNQVLPLTRGQIVGVFDADAQVPTDMLRRVCPSFQREAVGAVQMRKAIANASLNFWTRGQKAEMAFDTYLQQQRIAIGGIGELRGNGQFVRRTALESCGGWNEETITDDLDLTFRLHLDQWDIDFVIFPAVQEEGVTNAIALWHQRNRWAEGGYQRYLDYWRLLVSNRMGTLKTLDLFSFTIIQYILPAAAVPDCLMALVRNRPPVLAPISSFAITLPLLGIFIGLRRISKQEKFRTSNFFDTLVATLRGVFYLFHWILIMASTTARMSVRPKRLKWVKTVHHGTGDESLEF